MDSFLKNFTLNDCQAILKKKFNKTLKVESFKFCVINEKLGYFGDHRFLEICYSDEDKKQTLRLFAKIAPAIDSQRAYVEESGAFYKECTIFLNLFPEMLENGIEIISECVPTCYLALDMNYLIFEDLASKGCKCINPRISLTLEYAKLCLDSLAKLHCSSIIFEEKLKQKTGDTCKLNELHPQLFKESFYPKIESCKRYFEATNKGVCAEIDLFEDVGKIDLELFKQLTCNVLKNFSEIVKPSTKFRNTICHGDLWISNFMFEFHGNKPVNSYIVDFQTFRYAPPAQDFLAFVYLSTDAKFRQEHMNYLIDYYYDKMREIFSNYNLDIKEILPHEEFIDSLDYYKIFGIGTSVNHFQLIMVPPKDTEMLFETGKIQKVFFEDKTPIILEYCHKYEDYRTKLRETINDLKEVFIEQNKLQLLK